MKLLSVDSTATLFALANERALVDEVATLMFDGARANNSWDVARFYSYNTRDDRDWHRLFSANCFFKCAEN
jgi:hypothetical protein